jgi:proteasome lid subunit RPN8/RPN11
MGSRVLDPLDATVPGHLSISAWLWEQMRLDIEQHAPEEACGLLAGLENRVKMVLPITNELHSPVRYRMAAREQLDGFEKIDGASLELIGIYHSHPNGPNGPSATDIAEAFYPEALYLIWSAQDGVWSCRAFRIQEGRVQEVSLRVRNL